jgi:hypothetical protein
MKKEIEIRKELESRILKMIQDYNDEVKPYRFTNDDMINVLSSIIKEWTDVSEFNGENINCSTCKHFNKDVKFPKSDSICSYCSSDYSSWEKII